MIEFGLPEGWWISDRGPVSPNGRLYDRIPAGYEIEDLPIFDAILDGMLAVVEARPLHTNAIAGEVRLDDAIRPSRGVR